ncbi:MAG: archaeosortase/exosortase family protein [Geobacteraceae bacterium]|nr:archaeosortase/exosortase family protein [Geobacteraceae bacterium]
MSKKKHRTHTLGELEPDTSRVGLSSPLVKISILFVVFMCTFHAALWILWPEWKNNFQIQDLIAGIVSYLLNNIGITNIAQGNEIFLNNAVLQITQECTAINIMILFTSFVLAYTSSNKSKLIAIFAGIPFIMTANILRIVSIAVLTKYTPKYSGLIHDYIWQTAFLFLVISVCYLWVEVVVNNEEAHTVFP